MRFLFKTISVIVTVLLCQIVNVSAEQPVDSFPGAFPGSGGFPEPVMPSDLPPAYPEWPDRPMRREVIPPPPSGPYMSSALSDVDAFPADTGGLRHQMRQQQMQSPFFNVDMPWPETPDRGRPEPWVPETGEYRFVPKEMLRQLESPSSGRPPMPVMPQPYPGYRPVPPGYGYR